MQKRHRSHFFTAGFACLALAACVDAPTAPTNALDENTLAISFEVLADEQLLAGDVERGEEFRWAALAVRAGVAPTRFEVDHDGEVEVYDAFVHAVKWNVADQAIRPLTHRSFVAWRRTPEKMQVILIGSHLDVAPVIHPYSMRLSPGTIGQTSPIAGAHAAYLERSGERNTWLGVTGQVKLEQESVGGACNSPNQDTAPQGVSCQLARYEVRFEISFVPALGTQPRQLDLTAPLKQIDAAEQHVGGVKLTFSCGAPTSVRGCG